MSLRRRWLAGLLGVLVAFGVGLRLHHLDEKSLWADELFTLAIAKYYPFLPEEGQPLYRRISVLQIGDGDTYLTAKAAEQSPPLNDLLEKITVTWLGTTEFAARLPAVVARAFCCCGMPDSPGGSKIPQCAGYSCGVCFFSRSIPF